jgi:anti-sigma factor RsiW
MTARILPLDPDPHHAVQALLPWWLNDTLAPEERAAVQAHLAECAACRTALEFERELQAAETLTTLEDAGSSGAEDVEQGWASLQQRLQSPLPQAAQPLPADTASDTRPPPAPVSPWWRWVALAQAAALVLLMGALLWPAPAVDDRYRALGNAPSASADSAALLVRFRPEASEHELRDALRASGTRLVGGPTVTDGYLLAAAPGREAQALQQLRAHRAVLLAESLLPGGRP